MKSIRLFCAVFAAVFAESGFGAWTYDSGASTIADGNWVLGVSASGDDLTITDWTSGSGDLDLSSVYDDTGKRVVAVASHPTRTWNAVFGFNSLIKSVVAPDIVTLANKTFANSTAITNMALSANITSFSEYAFRCLNYLRSFSPAQSSSLTAIGNYSFNYTCQNLADGSSDVDLNFPALTSLGVCAFSGAKFPRSLTAMSLANVTANEIFLDNKGLKQLTLPALTKLTSARFCKGCTVLGDVELGGTATSLPTDAFNGCTSLSNVVLRAPIATLNAGALKDIAPNAAVLFCGEAPALANDSLSAVNGEAGFCRARVYAWLDETTSASWEAAVAPNAAQFEADKTRPDYPGEKTFGLLYDGVAYSWAIAVDWRLSVSSTAGAYGVVEPAFGNHFDLADGDTVEFSAPAEDVAVSDSLHVRYAGWKLYSVAADGSRTLLRSGDTLSGSFAYAEGTQYALEWQAVRLHRVYAESAAGGTVTVAPADSFVAEGCEVTFTPVPDAGRAFGMWSGVPVDRIVESPLRLVVTNAVAVAPTFCGKWTYDAEAMVISNDVWRLNVTADGGNLTVSSSAENVAGSGQLLLTSFPADVPGYHLTAFANGAKNSGTFWNVSVTALVAPEVTVVGDAMFFYRPLETVYLSPQVREIRYASFRNCRNMKRFFPMKMDCLTTLGAEAFVLCGASATGSIEPIDFDFPALTGISGNIIFADSKGVRSLCATNISVISGTDMFKGSAVERIELGGTATSIPASMCEGCTRLAKVVLPPSIASIGASAFGNIAGGATIRLPRRRAPEMGDACFYSKNADNRVRILIRRNFRDSGWGAVVSPVTSADRERADYPGEGTLGTISAVVDGVTYYTWVVETEQPLGMAVIFR